MQALIDHPWISLASALLVLALGAVAGGIVLGDRGGGYDGPFVPAPTAPADRRVAALQVEVTTDSAGSPRLRLRDIRVLADYAPNTIGIAGPWTVQLLDAAGTVVAEIGVGDPRRYEVFDPAATPPLGYGTMPSALWRLNVPLYRDFVLLDARGLRLLDERGSALPWDGVGGPLPPAGGASVLPIPPLQ